MNRFSWLGARSVAEAAAAASTTTAAAMSTADGAIVAEGSLIKAGGIDVLDLLKEGLMAPATLVSLSSVAELDAIAEETGGAIRIGSMITLARIAGHPLIRERYAALAEVAGSSASPQIRNVATIGGNLLQRPWYFRSSQYHCLRKGGDRCFALSGDNRYHAIFNNRPCAIVHPSSAATVLVALGAEVELVNADGNRRRLHLEEFLVPPSGDIRRENQIKPREVLTGVHLPRPGADVHKAYLRLGEKPLSTGRWPTSQRRSSARRVDIAGARSSYWVPRHLRRTARSALKKRLPAGRSTRMRRAPQLTQPSRTPRRFPAMLTSCRYSKR